MKGLSLPNLCLMFVYVCFVLYLCIALLCRFDSRRGSRGGSVLKCITAYDWVWSSAGDRAHTSFLNCYPTDLHTTPRVITQHVQKERKKPHSLLQAYHWGIPGPLFRKDVGVRAQKIGRTRDGLNSCRYLQNRHMEMLHTLVALLLWLLCPTQVRPPQVPAKGNGAHLKTKQKLTCVCFNTDQNAERVKKDADLKWDNNYKACEKCHFKHYFQATNRYYTNNRW